MVHRISADPGSSPIQGLRQTHLLLCGLAIITMIGGCVAAGSLFAHLGPSSLGIAGGGMMLGGGLLITLHYKEAKKLPLRMPSDILAPAQILGVHKGSKEVSLLSDVGVSVMPQKPEQGGELAHCSQRRPEVEIPNKNNAASFSPIERSSVGGIALEEASVEVLPAAGIPGLWLAPSYALRSQNFPYYCVQHRLSAHLPDKCNLVKKSWIYYADITSILHGLIAGRYPDTACVMSYSGLVHGITDWSYLSRENYIKNLAVYFTNIQSTYAPIYVEMQNAFKRFHDFEDEYHEYFGFTKLKRAQGISSGYDTQLKKGETEYKEKREVKLKIHEANLKRYRKIRAEYADQCLRNIKDARGSTMLFSLEEASRKHPNKAIIVPIYAERHFCTLYIEARNRPNPKIIYFESMGNYYGNWTEEKLLLKDLVDELNKDIPESRPHSRYRIVKALTQSIQDNGCDCGPFVIYWLMWKLENPDADVYEAQSDTPRKDCGFNALPVAALRKDVQRARVAYSHVLGELRERWTTIGMPEQGNPRMHTRISEWDFDTSH